MTDQFAGRLLAFKGEDEYVPSQDVLVEVTEVKDGMVELAFSMPVSGSPRVYISIPLAEVVRRSMAGDE